MYMAYSLRGLARSHIRTRADGIADLQKAITWAETNHYRVFHYRPRIYLAESLLLDGQLESALREANVMKRRRPILIASSLPHTLAQTPRSPITLATVAGARTIHVPRPDRAATKVRNVTTHARSADISQVWTQ